MRGKSPRQQAKTSAKQADSAAPELLDLHPGDVVTHNMFGRGTVRSVEPMPGDVMAEIDFETAGSKKLMLKYAGKLISKI